MRDIPTEQGNLFFALKRAHHDLTVAMAREVSVASGVPSAQAAALVYLVQHDGCSVGYLGDLLGLNSAGTAGLVTRLVRDDLVQKSANASDARVTQLHATARGRRVARRINALLKQLAGSASISRL